MPHFVLGQNGAFSFIGRTHRRIFSLLRSFAPALHKEYSLVASLARASNCIQCVRPILYKLIIHTLNYETPFSAYFFQSTHIRLLADCSARAVALRKALQKVRLRRRFVIQGNTAWSQASPPALGRGSNCIQCVRPIYDGSRENIRKSDFRIFSRL